MLDAVQEDQRMILEIRYVELHTTNLDISKPLHSFF